jgi:hypothetical protein
LRGASVILERIVALSAQYWPTFRQLMHEFARNNVWEFELSKSECLIAGQNIAQRAGKTYTLFSAAGSIFEERLI